MLRFAGIFIITPIFGSRIIPNRIKIGISFFMAMITLPILQQSIIIALPENLILIFLDLIRELAIGFSLGFIIYLVFSSLQLAGQLIDLRMGFLMVNIVDPMHGTSSPLIGQFKYILAILVFLLLNGHHILFENIFKSFEIIPLGGFVLSNSAWHFLFRAAGDIFVIALRVALPVMGTLFIADVIFAFLARTLPQMNIFIVGLPLKILIGFIILMLTIHGLIYFYQELFISLFKDLSRFMHLITP